MRTRHLWILAAALGTATTFAGPARADIIDCTIRDLQDTTSVLWDTLVVAQDTLRMSGVITGADTKASGFGFYIEDFTLAAQYRGIDVFTGGNNQFSTMHLAKGMKVRVRGKYGDFSGGTELLSETGAGFGPPLPIEILSSPGIPGPTIVSTTQITERDTLVEKYEGMFCKLNHQLRVTNTKNLPSNCFQAVDNTIVTPNDTILVDQETLCNPGISRPDSGTVFNLCQGIVDQRGVIVPPGSLRGYRIQVRNAGDTDLPNPPTLFDAYAVSNDSIRVIFDAPLDPITSQDITHYSRNTGKAIDSAHLQPSADGLNQIVVLAFGSDPLDLATPGELESLTVSGVKSAGLVPMTAPAGRKFRGGVLTVAQVQTSSSPYTGAGGSDASQYNGQVVTVRGTVTAHFQGSSLVFIEDPAGGLRSGMKLFAPSIDMNEGESVTLVGIPVEFFDETEFSGAIFERNHGAGVMPAPMVINGTGLEALNDTIPSGGTREDYEHVLLRITNVGATIPDTLVGTEWIVSRNDDCWNAYPTCEDTLHIDNRGYNDYAFRPVVGQNFTSITGPLEISFGVAKLEPRKDADFVLAATGVDGTPLAFALRNPVPNPASRGGGVDFAFTMPTRGTPTLRIFDLRGRIVSTVSFGRVFEPGPQMVRWGATDNAGRRVGPGIYFAQLQLGNQVASTKVVVAD